jgi:tripartite-type tricarboxylate transporter receptor subunit TctC
MVVRTMRRRFGILMLVLAATTAAAQDKYPSQPVRLINSFAAGSSSDVAMRILAPHLGRALGEQFVIENRPGASGNIAANYVAHAAPDGYTLLIGTVASTVNASLSPGLAFDLVKDLAPVVLVGTVPNILVAHPSLGVRSVAELIAAAKARPGAIDYASAGVGTSPHLTTELLNVTAGVKLVHVPYQGTSKAITDVIAGRVPVMFCPASTALPYVQAGTLVALAVTHRARLPAAPDVPTMAELGFTGFETGVWFGLLAPAKTPRPIIDAIARTANDVLKMDEVVSALQKQGISTLGGTPEEFARHIGSETQKWAKVVEAAGLRQ